EGDRATRPTRPQRDVTRLGTTLAVRLGGLGLLGGTEQTRHATPLARGLGAPAAGGVRAIVRVAVRDHDVERVDRRLLVRVAAGDPAAGPRALLLRLDHVVILAVGDVPELGRAADVDLAQPVGLDVEIAVHRRALGAVGRCLVRETQDR